MFAKHVLVTGCSRGIGLELVKHLVDKTETLFATCRCPLQAKELQAIAQANKNVVLLDLDVTKEDSIQRAAEVVKNMVKGDGLNCLINNAGDIDRTESFETTDVNVFRRLHEINVIGPVMMIKAFLPLIKQASSTRHDDVMSVSRASVLNMSGMYGSIGCANSTDNLCYAYRMSKPSLNMLTKLLSLEYKTDKIMVLSIHPGHVRTDMGGPLGEIDVTQSVAGIMSLLPSLNDDSSGMFYAWNGSVVPW